MKKLFNILIIISILFTLVACSKSRIVVCTVVEVDNNSLIVTPVDGSFELNSSDRFSVNKSHVLEDVKVGDTIEIKYSGEILEIYPAIFSDIVYVKKK